jgi:hypothetical protein
VLGWCAPGALGRPAAASEPVYTNQLRFRIPYQLDTEEISRLGATEIQLHVSTDDGHEWRHVGSVPPVAGKFTFDAAGDGSYAFAVRTLDREGRAHPEGPLTTTLQVVVDATPPTLELDIQQTESGRVQLSWRASDVNLDPDSLVLEQLDASTSRWQTIAVSSGANGQTNWPLPEGGTVRVRGQIRDRAGNETIAQASAEIADPPESVVDPTRTQPRQGGASANPRLFDDPETYETSATPLPEINPDSVVISRPVSSTPEEVAKPRWEPTPARPAASVRRVNSTTFQIMYELDDVGPSGVSSIDLYLTENEGRKWYHYGADEDRRSPFQITVPNDGVYGFAIRVRSGVGLTLTPPQPHDPPELSVAVDRQPPRINLLPLRQGQGPTSKQVFIEWSLTEEALAEEPVALSYSEHRSGPWQPLTGWQRNSNRYAWTLEPHVPAQVYVRLEARDAAGNVAQVETDSPLIIDLSRPTARMLNVESIR